MLYEIVLEINSTPGHIFGENCNSKRYTPPPIFTLFTIAKTWKQPKCLLTDEWIKKMWYISAMAYYSAIKKNEIMPFAAAWMDLEIFILSELSQTKTNTAYMWTLKMIQMNLCTKK